MKARPIEEHAPLHGREPGNHRPPVTFQSRASSLGRCKPVPQQRSRHRPEPTPSKRSMTSLAARVNSARCSSYPWRVRRSAEEPACGHDATATTSGQYARGARALGGATNAPADWQHEAPRPLGRISDHVPLLRRRELVQRRAVRRPTAGAGRRGILLNTHGTSKTRREFTELLAELSDLADSELTELKGQVNR
jgi:hypothetical protein